LKEKGEAMNRRILREWLGLCAHVWEQISVSEISRSDGTVVGKFYVLRCKKCGDVVSRKLKL
jgi:hypothetical protein